MRKTSCNLRCRWLNSMHSAPKKTNQKPRAYVISKLGARGLGFYFLVANTNSWSVPAPSMSQSKAERNHKENQNKQGKETEKGQFNKPKKLRFSPSGCPFRLWESHTLFGMQPLLWSFERLDGPKLGYHKISGVTLGCPGTLMSTLTCKCVITMVIPWL